MKEWHAKKITGGGIEFVWFEQRSKEIYEAVLFENLKMPKTL